MNPKYAKILTSIAAVVIIAMTVYGFFSMLDDAGILHITFG